MSKTDKEFIGELIGKPYAEQMRQIYKYNGSELIGATHQGKLGSMNEAEIEAAMIEIAGMMRLRKDSLRSKR